MMSSQKELVLLKDLGTEERIKLLRKQKKKAFESDFTRFTMNLQKKEIQMLLLVD